MDLQPGTVIFLGPQEIGDSVLASQILSGSQETSVAVIPTAKAFEGIESAVVSLAEWLTPFGAKVEGLMITSRGDASLVDMADRIQDAELIYVTDGSSIHLRTAVKETVLFDALLGALNSGKTIVASGASATVLCDPMIDPRGGAPTLGLGPVQAFTVVPLDADDVHQEKLHRTIAMMASRHPVVTIAQHAGLRCRSDGGYDALGSQDVCVYRDGLLIEDGVSSLAPWWEASS